MLFTRNQIFLDLDIKEKEDVLKFIAKKANELNIAKSEKTLYKELVEREEIYPTAVEELIAIPHSKSENINESKLFFLKLNNPIDWNSPDDYKVKVLFVILVPKFEANEGHVSILSSIAVNLLEEDFQNFILNIKDEQKLLDYFYSKYNKEAE